MAGYYPDAPDLKIYYNDDGSAVFNQPTTGGAVTSVSAGNISTINSENNNNGPNLSTGTRLGFVFPQALDITGLFVYTNLDPVPDTSGVVRTSPDTTNGTDGNWTVRTSTFPIAGYNDLNVTTRWRTHIQSVAYNGVRGLTISGNGVFARQVHLYGRPSVGENPDRLRFWHPTNDSEITGAHFDFADTAQGQTKIIQFRIKNNSSTKTATTITIGDDALTPASPTLASQTTFSLDGSAYSSSISISSIGPQGTSSVLYAKMALVANAQIGPWRQRLKAAATVWS